MVDSCEVTNVDWIVTNKSQKFTREVRNRWRLLVSVSLTLQGIFLNFQEHLCAFTAHLFLRNYSLQFYNNRLLFYVEMCLQLLFCWANTNQARHVKPPTVCYLHVNIHQMSIINQSAFLIWNKAAVGTLQYSIWK